jgi:hypothetical protein
MDQREIDPGLRLHGCQIGGTLEVVLGFCKPTLAQKDLAKLTMCVGVVRALFEHAEPGPGRAFDITTLSKQARISFKSLSWRFHVRADRRGLCDQKEKDGPEGPS